MFACLSCRPISGHVRCDADRGRTGGGAAALPGVRALRWGRKRYRRWVRTTGNQEITLGRGLGFLPLDEALDLWNLLARRAQPRERCPGT